MRSFWDWRFHRQERKTEIDPAAFSQDGYLIHQGRLGGISYGSKTSRETGCGWIACYNFLRFMGAEEPAREVAGQMERMLLWGGRIGSHPLAVWWYLHRRGYRFRLACTRRGMDRILGKAPERTAGIIAYWHGRGAHYAAFIREAEGDRPGEEAGKLRFLNAVYGMENHRLTPEEFYRKHVRFPITMVLVDR
ncbi:MAG: hypothetical protein HFI38_10670 [Lachnospiraceae bacterium]|jgi:hypothetical protein|nr:hypothetical protein [Lachnospiraceae bacterium]